MVKYSSKCEDLFSCKMGIHIDQPVEEQEGKLDTEII